MKNRIYNWQFKSIFLIILFTAFNLHAQFPLMELSWKNISFGKKSITVYSIFKDTADIIWLGTDSGLYFFDGVRAREAGFPELGGYHINSILQKDDKLYVGTNNGLFIIELTNGSIRQEEAVSTGEIRTMLLNGEDIWIGSLYGIYKYNTRNKSFSDLTKGLPSPAVYSIIRDSRGILYAGTYKGLARWDSIDGNFHEVLRNISQGNTPFFVNCLLESDDKRSIYVGGDNTLYKYTPSTDQWEKSKLVSDVNVKSLTNGKNGHLIIGTDDGLFDVGHDTVRHFRHDSRLPQSLANNEIWSVFYDDNSNIWAGHEKGFSITSDSEYIKNYTLGMITQNGEGNEINRILRDFSGNLWLAGSNGLIRLSDNDRSQWFRHGDENTSISHNRIRDILQTEDGKVLLATDAGINLYNGKNEFAHFNIHDSTGNFSANWSYSIKQNGQDIIIGSFLGGILAVDSLKFNKSKSLDITANLAINTDTKPWIANNLVNQIESDSNGNIWILLFRDNALVKFNSKMEKLKDFNIFEIAGSYPTHISADDYGRIWCGFKGGVVMFDENDNANIIRFDHSERSDETIIAMAAVDNEIWISTLSNLWKIDGKSLFPTLLPIPQKGYTSIYKDPDSGNVLLGGSDQITVIDPSLINYISNQDFLSLIVKDSGDRLWHFSSHDPIKSGLVLPYKGTLELIIHNTNYSPDNLTNYMYKLASSPKDTIGNWKILPEGMNTLTLSDLNMGKYLLMIKTQGNNSYSLSIPLKVDAPPALSWWAISLYSVSLIIILIAIIIYFEYKKKQKFLSSQRESELKNAERKLTFLTSVSHDLKTPLSMIMGPVSILKEKVKDMEDRKNLQTVYDNAVKINNMIQKSIELQNLEDAEESILIMSRIEVVEFCKSIFEDFKENNPSRIFIFHSDSKDVFIEADVVKFESVITNLLSNACKYSEDGSTVSMGIAVIGRDVEITVSDDGFGIAEEDKSLVFQKMFRSPNLSKKVEGSGLGLYLTKRYIEQMDGTIRLYSNKGQGSSFIVSLPLSEELIKKNVSETTSTTSGKQKILIVEDNSQISSFVTSLLKKDYDIVIAENGRSGLAVASSFQPDIIIVDEMMPVMSGLEMTRRIKQTPLLNSIPIIMLTAKTDNYTEAESIKLGIDTFIAKPFDPANLIGRVHQLIKSKTNLLDKIRMETIMANETKPIEAESTNEKAIAKVIKIIEDNISDPDLNVEMLCRLSGLSNKNLYRLIKKSVGKAPLEFIRTIRLQKAAVLLEQKRFTVSEICFMVGFKTPSYFAKCFQLQYGKTPSEYMISN